MTPLRAKKLLPIITAFAEGKRIQFNGKNIYKNWTDVEDPVFSSNFEYRVKPTSKLRPWKPEEVPVGAVVRHKKTGLRMLIEGNNNDVVVMRAGDYSMELLLENWMYSVDFGRTWLPCGVMEYGQ